MRVTKVRNVIFVDTQNTFSLTNLQVRDRITELIEKAI